MNREDILSAFVGLEEKWKDLLGRELRDDLAASIKQVNEECAKSGKTSKDLSPTPSLIFNWAILTPYDDVKVVLLGQDPYIGEGEAMGLAFSVSRGRRVPPSLRNMYGCWKHNGLMPHVPEHGDLTALAKQGVLMLNSALTTVIGTSNAHQKCWSAYTDNILKALSAKKSNLVFILLGGFAHRKATLIDSRKHLILKWCHPSPLAPANKSDNPENFKYCDAFVKANEYLQKNGKRPITWDPETVIAATPAAAQPAAVKATQPADVKATQPTNDHPTKLKVFMRDVTAEDPAIVDNVSTYMFTDGGSKANGRANCTASFAFYITNGCKVLEGFGMVDEVEIPGEKYKTSNNRGELTAIKSGLDHLKQNLSEFDGPILCVSDSEYSINCITQWVEKWLSNPAANKLSEKKNLDLIVPAKEAYDEIGEQAEISFKHMRSHQPEPADKESIEWFMWACNDRVDRLCSRALKEL